MGGFNLRVRGSIPFGVWYGFLLTTLVRKGLQHRVLGTTGEGWDLGCLLLASSGSKPKAYTRLMHPSTLNPNSSLNTVSRSWGARLRVSMRPKCNRSIGCSGLVDLKAAVAASSGFRV